MGIEHDDTFYELCVNLAHQWYARGDWDGYIYFWTMRYGIEPPDEHAAYQRYKDGSVFGDPLAPLYQDVEPQSDGIAEEIDRMLYPSPAPVNRRARRTQAALARRRAPA